MVKVANLESPNGWLVDPQNKWASHFDFKILSNDDTGTDFIIDMWSVLPNGKPMEFKSRRKVSKNDSQKIWKQLIESNWVELDFNNINAA